MGTTSNLGMPYPESYDAAQPHTDIKLLADKIDDLFTPNWNLLSVNSGWGYDTATARPRWWKDPMGFVHLAGSPYQTTANEHMATLPVGARPTIIGESTFFLNFAVATNSATGFNTGLLQVRNNGVIALHAQENPNEWNGFTPFALDHIKFYAG